MSVEHNLNEWMKQPGAVVTTAERNFIDDMRKAAANSVGYGWMQQIIEWEWQHNSGRAWGPKFFGMIISDLENQVTNREAEITNLMQENTKLRGVNAELLEAAQAAFRLLLDLRDKRGVIGDSPVVRQLGVAIVMAVEK